MLQQQHSFLLVSQLLNLLVLESKEDAWIAGQDAVPGGEAVVALLGDMCNYHNMRRSNSILVALGYSLSAPAALELRSALTGNHFVAREVAKNVIVGTFAKRCCKCHWCSMLDKHYT